jgi:para-nitrobenzyl esterase
MDNTTYESQHEEHAGSMQGAFSSSARPRSWSPFVFSLLVAVLGSAPAPAHDDGHGHGEGPLVNTVEGPVRGYTKDGVNIFLGIPYAAPPIGPLRWQPPQPAKRWRETLDATHYRNTCPQVSEDGAFAGPASITEDCLYLNVFTTGSGRSGKKKPVLVWIHGGGNTSGESDDYNASKLATGGPNGAETVVVTMNYRLGLLGTFSHPAIDAEGHLWGNYAILDQQAVLKWVRRNIASFGGDSRVVAVGGQSAGSYDTASQVLSPLGKGLLNRAIFQSSPGLLTSAFFTTAASALSRGTSFATAAGCSGSNAAAAACLRKLSAARILQLQGTPNSEGPYVSNWPIVDGTIIPIAPDQAWATGSFNKMPVMGGATHDELTFTTGIAEYFSGPPQAPITADQYAARIATGAPCAFCAGGIMPSGAAALYPLSNYGGDPMLAYDRVTTDPFRCIEVRVMQKIAAQVPTYAYDFTYPNSPFYYPQMPGFKALASHTIDIQFLFNNYHGGPLGVNLDQTTGQPRELNAQETALSDQMVAAWTNFVKTGNPNGAGNSPWPKFSADSSATYFVEDVPISTMSVSQFRADHKCDFWDVQPSK